MKNIFTFFLFIFSFSFLLVSCKSDSDDDLPANVANLKDDNHWFFDFNGTVDGGEGWDLIKSSVDGKLYVCGAFLHVNNNWDMKNLARLNLSDYTWEQVPGIDEYTTNFIRCVAEDSDGNLYFGGDFSTIGGTPAHRVAKFNPSTGEWSALRDIDFYIEGEQYGPVSGGVYAIEVINNYVYIGGGIFNSDSTELRYIRRFNLTSNKWENVPGGVNADVNAFEKDASGNLYVGGEFTQAGNITANYIAKWDGTNWSALGSGTDDYVLAIECSGTNVYAGGSFKNVGENIRSQGIAKWTGTNWEAMDKGVDESDGSTYSVEEIAVDSDGLVYIGGYFNITYSDLDTLNHVGVFMENKWRQLGSGLGQTSTQGVMGIYADGKNIYFTGYFSKGTGSGNDHINMAIWNEDETF
jgi:hypothetical protein